MKNYFPKFITLLALVVLGSYTYAQCAGGKIRVDAAQCFRSNGTQVTLKLSGHTTSGATYSWQRANSNTPFNFSTMSANSGADTQNINSGLFGWYRCMVTTGSGVCFSDTFIIVFRQRSLVLSRIQCGSDSGRNDSVVLKASLATNQPWLDTNSAKFYRWESTLAGATLWNLYASTTVDSVKVPYNSIAKDYQVKLSLCPLATSTSPTPFANQLVTPPYRVGTKPSTLIITSKDCANDTVEIGLDSSYNLRDSLKYTWHFSSSPVLNTFNTIAGATASRYKFKPVFRQDMYFYATSRLCAAPPSKVIDTTKVFGFNVRQGVFSAAFNCQTNQVDIDYTRRDTIRKSVSTTWYRSTNDTLNPQLYTPPVDSMKYGTILLNKTNYYYKIITKLCPNSTSILDSSYYVQTMLNVDSGELKADTMACNNDSVYMTLLNYNAQASFPLTSVWEYIPNGTSTWIDYTQTPQTLTSITTRLQNGQTYYRRSSYFCPNNKYVTRVSSSVVSTFLPYLVVMNLNCTSNLVARVQNDTIRIKDYTGTKFRGQNSSTYIWQRTANKTTWTTVASATGDTLLVANSDKGFFFRRVSKVCPSSSFTNITEWTNYNGTTPTALNGRAVVLDEICLDRDVTIGVTNFIPRSGETPFYIWQWSPNELQWYNLYTNDGNKDTINVLVTSGFKYFRRLTYWCSSGIMDSSASVPLVYNRPVGCESFISQIIMGPNVLYNCWGFTNACPSYSATYGTNPIISVASGKSNNGLQHQPSPPQPRTADGKIITPAFQLDRTKIYRFSFWHKEDAVNLCWDSLYVTWGRKPTACDMTNKFGTNLTKFSFDQWNKFWADFLPPDDGVYYFAINYRDKDNLPSPYNIQFDDICVKEVLPCTGKNPEKGRTFAPAKIIQRSEEPFAEPNYEKLNPTHQYCLWDTIMLTYQEDNYLNNFDYYGMSYQFYKMRYDEDWKVNDYFYSPIPGNNNCHITNRTDYHVLNVMATDTNTYYKIVATCDLDGRQFHADSIVVNGTHSLPYCDNWETLGSISNTQNAPAISALMPVNGIGNSGQIIGKVPSFSNCPTCWAAFPQPSPPAPNAADISLASISLPFRNTAGGTPLTPQLEPDAGFNSGNNVVATTDNRTMAKTKNLLVFPAVRMYKGRGYRITFRWSDNRKDLGAPLYGDDANYLDSLYIMWAKGNRQGEAMNNFTTANMIGGADRQLKSNIKEIGTFKYRTFWRDFTPSDTGTYYIAIAVVPGTNTSAAYRFVMDYFCIDTIQIDTGCNAKPRFSDPLLVKISPDFKEWRPGETTTGGSSLWCVGTPMTAELTFDPSNTNSWAYGWKYIWERNIVDSNFTNQVPKVWTTYSTSNGISWTLRAKFEEYRLRITNFCGTQDIIVGPFDIFPGGLGNARCGGTSAWEETFDSTAGRLPSCWDWYTTPNCNTFKSTVTNNTALLYGPKSGDWYLELDNMQNILSCGISPAMTVVPPGRSVIPGGNYRFSFWVRDNGFSQLWDSIRVGWSYSRPSATWPAPNTLPNKINNDIIRNFRSNKWRYYTTDFTTTLDTVYHFKVSAHLTATNKRLFRLLYEDFLFKPKYNKDALVIAVDSPDYQCDLTANTTVKIQVMNIGTATLDSIPIGWSVDDVKFGTATVSGPVTSNGVRIFYVPNVDLSKPGVNKVKVWTNIAGEQYACDDTFTVDIINNEMYATPTDTVDTICIYKPLKYGEDKSLAQFGQVKWYRNLNDVEPFAIGDSFVMDSIKKDTCVYRSLWNGDVCYTTPKFAPFSGQWSALTAGITFNNWSRDTIIIDSTMVYANTIGNGSVSFSQYGTTFKTVPFNITVPGKQFLPIKVKIPPGTDYKMVYTGSASMAILPSGAPYYYIFGLNGCPSMGLDILGDHNYPTLPVAYYYFFNMKLLKQGCETPKVQICFRTVPNPTFQIKDTQRVCQLPVYQVCGPTPPIGFSYTYQWSSGKTTICDSALTSSNYKLTVTNQFGCTATDNLNLIVDSTPKFTLGNDTSYCRNALHRFDTRLYPPNNIVSWINTLTGGTASGTYTDVSTPGTYIATAYHKDNFCKYADTVVLTRVELPVFSLGNDRVFCGSTANVSEQLNTPNMTYTWYTSNGGWATSPPIANKSGTYWVIGEDNTTKCKNSDTIAVTLIANPNLDLGLDKVICGSSYTLAPVTPAPGSYSYVWNTTQTSRSISVSNPGTYKLTIQDTIYGCKSSDSIKVRFIGVPYFTLQADTILCADNYLILGPGSFSDPVVYTWIGPKGNVVGRAQNQLIDTSGVYILKVGIKVDGLASTPICYEYQDSVRITLKKTPQSALDKLPATGADTGCGQVTLTATSEPLKAQVRWGNPLNVSTNMVTINKSGSYAVTLKNECGEAAKSVYVRIDTTPKADFNAFSLPNCMSIGITNLSKNATKFEWDFGDGGTSTLENPLHNYTIEGNYIVVLKASNSCGSQSKSKQIPKRVKNCDSFALSIVGSLDQASLGLFPNPTKNTTTLYGMGIPNGKYQISVKNILGQSVEEREEKVYNNKLEVSIDASKLSNGEYLIQVTNEGETTVRRLIVDR